MSNQRDTIPEFDWKARALSAEAEATHYREALKRIAEPLPKVTTTTPPAQRGPENPSYEHPSDIARQALADQEQER